MKTPLLVFLALLLRILFYSFYFNASTWNTHMAQRFDERALAILQGQDINNVAGWGSYPLFLATLYKILDWCQLLGHRLVVVYTFYQVLGLLTAFVVYRVLKANKVSSNISFVIVSILFLFNPLQIYINSMNISESLFQLTSVLAVALYLNTFPMSELKRWSLFFLCLALSTLARNMILPFVILLPFWVLLKQRAELSPFRSRDFWAGLLLGGLILWSASFLNSIFDRQASQTLSSNRGANLAQTWCEAPIINYKTELSSFWFSPPEFWRLEQTRSLYLDRDFAETSYYVQLAAQCLQKDPSLVFLRLRSLLAIFDGPLYPDPLRLSVTLLNRIISWGYLALFLFVLLSARSLWRDPRGGFLLLFIGAGGLAVYVGNVGEARFLYSLLPVLAILIGLTWQMTSGRKKFWRMFSSALLALGLWSVPSLSSLMGKRDQARFSSLSQEKRTEMIRERLAKVPTVSSQSEGLLCASEVETKFPAAKNCLDAAEATPCSKESVKAIYADFLALQRKSLTEDELFCRNLTMIRLVQDRHVPVPAYLVQKPSPLPGGLEPINHPLVAIAGQLLQAELLRLDNHEEMMPAGETRDQLLYVLLKYQHRLDFNRKEYKGSVSASLMGDAPSDQAAALFVETLKRYLKASY